MTTIDVIDVNMQFAVVHMTDTEFEEEFGERSNIYNVYEIPNYRTILFDLEDTELAALNVTDCENEQYLTDAHALREKLERRGGSALAQTKRPIVTTQVRQNPEIKLRRIVPELLINQSCLPVAIQADM
jgi:hypothetical protein